MPKTVSWLVEARCPGLVEGWLSRQRLLLGVVVMVVVGFEFDGWDVAGLAVESDLVEPPNPVQGGEFEVVDAAPGAFMSNAFGLVEPDHRFGRGVVEAVADSAD